MNKKIGIVLLAAGNSKRYQGIKLLTVIQGKKMFENVLEITSSLDFPKIMVTQYREIELKALEKGFTVIINHEPNLGISYSIKLGLIEVLKQQPDVDGVLFSVCDQPFLEKETIVRLMKEYDSSENSMACLTYEGVLGNPCIIGKKYFELVFELNGDVGGKKIINGNREDVLFVSADHKNELIDIDRKEDQLKFE